MIGSDIKFVLLAIIACAFGLGCGRCDGNRQAAIQSVLSQLDNTTASNLLLEASLCIANSSTQSLEQAMYVYRPPEKDVPVAFRLGEKTALGRAVCDVFVDREGLNTPYMVVEVPVYFRGFCWWRVYVFVKPGGTFLRTNAKAVLGEALSHEDSLVRFSDEILLYAKQRTEEASSASQQPAATRP